MPILLKQFLNICLLNGGPQHLPWSSSLLHFSLVAYLMSGVLSMLAAVPLYQALPIMLVDTGLLLFYPWLCLLAFNKTSRFIQMSAALAGTGAVFQLMVWPFMSYLEPQSDNYASILAVVFLIGMWNLVVYAHIFRESFNIRLLSAFMLALTYAVISATLRQLLFPDAGV